MNYKTLTFVKIVLIFFFLCQSINVIGQEKIRDTTFILKENTDGIYHSIYVDPNLNSRYYSYISDYSFGKFDRESYKESLDYLKKHNLKLTKVTTGDLPKKWILLYQYQQKFYVYSPSDFYYHYKIKITDNSYIDFSGEGPHANKISSFKKKGEQTFEFKLDGFGNQSRIVKIHIIDKTQGIAVFEETSTDRDTFYLLMVDASKIRNFPLIVNYCRNQKQAEFDFDKPDFAKLLEGEQ